MRPFIPVIWALAAALWMASFLVRPAEGGARKPADAKRIAALKRRLHPIEAAVEIPAPASPAAAADAAPRPEVLLEGLDENVRVDVMLRRIRARMGEEERLDRCLARIRQTWLAAMRLQLREDGMAESTIDAALAAAEEPLLRLALQMDTDLEEVTTGAAERPEEILAAYGRNQKAVLDAALKDAQAAMAGTGAAGALDRLWLRRSLEPATWVDSLSRNLPEDLGLKDAWPHFRSELEAVIARQLATGNAVVVQSPGSSSQLYITESGRTALKEQLLLMRTHCPPESLQRFEEEVASRADMFRDARYLVQMVEGLRRLDGR